MNLWLYQAKKERIISDVMYTTSDTTNNFEIAIYTEKNR